MNSYGDSQSPRARARVSGSGVSAPDDDQSSGRYSDEDRPAPDAYRRGAAGRASVGGAPVRPTAGRASVGGGPMGSAPVGGATGAARVGGRASVGAGTGAVGGRASVARAAVRPGFDTPESPGGPGRLGIGKDISKAAKRRRRTNILTAAAAVVVILLGAGVVGGTYFFDSVQLPQEHAEDQANVLKFSDGSALLTDGEQNRTIVPEAQINKYIKDAVIAAEDQNFRSHHGIDMKGIVRAAWNNFTGGATQGASTITQQYARHIAKLKAISINRKLREAVIARRLESQYSKDEILGRYLNYLDLGEGRYGVEAAAQGYFGKSVLTKVGDKNAITPYEAAVLASIIKQPYPDNVSQGFDPNFNPTGAQERWQYTMKNMLTAGAITQEQYNQRKYPVVKKRGQSACKTCQADGPAGMVKRHVYAELMAMNIPLTEIEQGGYTITTTINPKVQKAAERAGSRNSETSPLHGRPKTYQSTVIGIDPKTGGVLGYYAGDDPEGQDFGGYVDAKTYKVAGGQSPGSSFKIYTLAAGLKENLSFDSIWDSSLKRKNGKKINNADADDNNLCNGKPRSCDLETATIKSYNFPFYWIADAIGVDKVVAAAKAAGIKHMFTDSKKGFVNGEMIDLTKTDKSTWVKNGNFDREVGFGQYRVPPLEHAEGVATIVNDGVHHLAHFIKSVKRVDPDTGKTTNIGQEKKDGNRVFPEDQMSNLQGVLKKIVDVDDRDLQDGRESIAKSGTWEFSESKGGSGDCWFVGGIPQLAATVWVGGAKDRVSLKESNGRDMFGALTPSRIWKQFLDESVAAMKMDREDFPQRQKTGDASLFGNGQKIPDRQNDCALQLIGIDCNNRGGNNNGGNDDNNGNTDGNNNGGNGNDTGATTTFPFSTTPTTPSTN
jgi:membrane peptidoglycan carboxypeptidase